MNIDRRAAYLEYVQRNDGPGAGDISVRDSHLADPALERRVVELDHCAGAEEPKDAR